jgi:hypothetical protein
VEAGKPADYRYPKKIRRYTGLGKIEKHCSSPRNQNRASACSVKEKGIFDVLDANFLRLKNDPDHIEPEGVAGPLEARYPDLRRSTQLALLSPVNGAHGAAEIVRRARLHLDERDCPSPVTLIARSNQIDIAAPVPKPPLGDTPSVNLEPPGGDTLAPFSHRLPSLRHGREPIARSDSASIWTTRTKTFSRGAPV